MQFIKKTSSRTNILGLIIKLALVFIIILGIVFLLNQIDFPAPKKVIEKKTGMKISKIFKEKGEIFFRKVEEKISLEILKKDNIVIALGGGAFLNKKIMEEILKNHLSFWLKWNDKVLIQRIKNSQKRPLAFNLDDNELTNLIKKRSRIYSKAKFKINCNNLTKNQIVNKIMNIYEKN